MKTFLAWLLWLWIAAVIVGAFYYAPLAAGFIGESSRILFFGSAPGYDDMKTVGEVLRDPVAIQRRRNRIECSGRDQDGHRRAHRFSIICGHVTPRPLIARLAHLA